MALPHCFGPSLPELSRRRMLQGTGASGLLTLGLAGSVSPMPALAQAPLSGGTLRIRGWDPSGWDPFRTASFRTHMALSFTHNRLFRYRSGPEVSIGEMIVEPDLVERWEAPSDTRYIFHLRQGVRFHDKPPVNGRELVAEDVRFSIETFLTTPGNSNRSLLDNITDVHVLGKYSLQVDLQTPNVWFLDYLAEASTLPIIAKELLDTFRNLKKPETVIGTGPWMLASYTPNVEAVFERNPHYFRDGVPYIDTVRLLIMQDGATAQAAYMAGQLDLAPGFRHTLRTRSLQSFKHKHPDWYYKGFRPNNMSYLAMRSDQTPFSDARVRRAVSLAIDRKTSKSRWRRANTTVPAGLRNWHLPIDQLGEGAKYYDHNPDEAKRLLTEAGYARGFDTPMLVHSGYSSGWSDYIDRIVRYLGEVGIRVTLIDKEYGSYVRLLSRHQYDGMAMLLSKPYVTPDGYIYGRYRAEKNHSHVDDAELRQLAEAQRREKDVKKRKAIIDKFSRLAAVKQYYVYFNSWPRIASWQPHVMNFNTNLGYDYGGRLQFAWLSKF